MSIVPSMSMRVCYLTSGRQFTTSALGIYSTTQRLAKRKEYLPLVLVCCPLLRRVHASLCLGNHLVHLPRGSGQPSPALATFSPLPPEQPLCHRLLSAGSKAGQSHLSSLRSMVVMLPRLGTKETRTARLRSKERLLLRLRLKSKHYLQKPLLLVVDRHKLTVYLQKELSRFVQCVTKRSTKKASIGTISRTRRRRPPSGVTLAEKTSL